MTKFICETKNLSKKYKDFYALKNVNLTIPKGEIYGLVGENGAGKTTLIRLLTGLNFKSEGEIILFGHKDNLQHERSKIGCTIEMPALYKDMTASQNLEVQRIHQLATCYGFLHKGELLKQISTEELNEECKRHICLRTDNIQKTTLLLEQKGNINNYSVYPDNSIRIYECLDNVRMISKLLSSNGVIIDEISVQGENLETYFENLIGGRKNV